MKKIILILCILFAGLTLQANNADAYIIAGTTNFAVAGQWSGYATWTVLAPMDTVFPAGWTATWSATSDYSYFYQIHNNANSSLSLTQFAIGNPYKTTLTSVAYLNATGDVSPSGVSGGTYGAIFNFDYSSGSQIDPGQTSDILYLTSAFPPGTASAGLQAPGYNDFQNVPMPVPEPGSLVLLGMGILGLFGLGRKKL